MYWIGLDGDEFFWGLKGGGAKSLVFQVQNIADIGYTIISLHLGTNVSTQKGYHKKVCTCESRVYAVMTDEGLSMI